MFFKKTKEQIFKKLLFIFIEFSLYFKRKQDGTGVTRTCDKIYVLLF